MTTLFFISMFALAVMLSSKLFELKVRKIDFLSNTFLKGDETIHEFIELGTLKYNRYKNISHIFVFDFLPSYLYEILVKMKDYVSKKYYEAGEGFRGKRVLRNNGSVSFFLERLSENKADTSGMGPSVENKL